LAGTLFGLDAVPSPDDPVACSLMNVYIVNITPAAGHTLASGNGNGMLTLGSTVVTQQFANATSMTIEINPALPGGFRDALWDNADNQSAREVITCGNVHRIPPADPLEPDPPIQLTFDTIPNMTLNRKISEITLGAD
jgi:hypothetical protein